MTVEFRFPAEWEPQSAVLLAWPHSKTDWQPRLAEVEQTYIALVAAITRFQPVALCFCAELSQHALAERLQTAGISLERVHFCPVDYHDTWLRDSGPLVLTSVNNQRYRVLDVRFTGWGGKYAADKDDLIVKRLHDQGFFGQADLVTSPFALEGGAVETDGQGTLLSTWQCFKQRHPHLSRRSIETTLQQLLAVKRIMWLEAGALEGDDTDAHIDTLARFSSPTSIVYQSCQDRKDPHFSSLAAMATELCALRTLNNQPYHLFALPWPRPIYDLGRRLAASYANFLMINQAVLMPTYDDPADQLACDVLARAFPHKQIIPIPCKPLIWQNGSLHCITMQLPLGLFSRSH